MLISVNQHEPLAPGSFLTLSPVHFNEPAHGVSVKSVRLGAGRLGFYSRTGHTIDFKIVFATFMPGARHNRKGKGFCVRVVRHVCPLTAFNHS